MIRAAAALALLLPLAAADRDPLAGRMAGKPVECIDPSVGGPTIVDSRTIVYGLGQRTSYRTEVEGCPALRPFTTLITEMWGSRLCRNDRFRVREPNAIIPSASCRFGAFVPYTRVRGRNG